MNSHNNQLAYLNIDLGESSVKQSIDGKPLLCFSKEAHKHRYHSDQTQLNLISDLCTNLLQNLATQNQLDSQSFSQISKRIENNNTSISEVLEKLDYVKQLINTNKRTLSTTELQGTLYRIEQKTKDLSAVYNLLSNNIRTLTTTVERLEEKIIKIEAGSLPQISAQLQRLF